MKKFFSLMLALAMCCSLAVSVSAAGDREYIGDPMTIPVSPYSYKAWSEMYVGSDYRAATYVQTSNNRDVPANYIKCQARLYDLAGDRVITSREVSSNVPTNLEAVVTNHCATTEAYSRGWAAFKNQYGDYERYDLIKTKTIMLGRSSGVDGLEALKCSLDENGQYPVNRLGESYGSDLLSEVVGEVPDLISAVGVDGVRGYIRDEDTHAKYDEPLDQDVLIPLYDVNGNVIGSYVLSGIDLEATEAMKQEILQRQH